MKIEQEIQQKKFESEYQKAQINILFTASWLSTLTTEALKPFNISWQQFNILRILRGVHPEGTSIKVLTERMIDKMSNASRLVDKLLQKGYVDRQACPEDRRRVDVKITSEGLKIIGEASEVMEQSLFKQMENLSVTEAELLNKLLDQLRA